MKPINLLQTLLIALFFSTMLPGISACSKGDDVPVPPVATTDSFTVNITNGYGGGKYKTGDTVHIFSNGYSGSQIFDKWTGTDINLLNGPTEWHTWFIMPAKPVNISGSVKNITPFTYQFEQIMGRDRQKPVYYYFPTGHKGLVYLLHGTGGKASNTASSFEFTQLARDLVNDGYGIVITEAEEATTGVDVNGDGKLRWTSVPADTLANIDYVNIRLITENLYSRNISNRSLPRYTVGMSNGGAFSAALSAIYRFKAGVSYCAPGGNPVAQFSNTPFQFCMARFDNNDGVGPQGNADAFSNNQTLLGRGVCSKYYITEHSPVYPERFARRGTISIAKSQAVFNEIKSKGFLTSKNYFAGFSDVYVTAATANPATFPELFSLSILQRLEVIEEIDLAVADHQMYSDYNRATLKFLNTQCL